MSGIADYKMQSSVGSLDGCIPYAQARYSKRREHACESKKGVPCATLGGAELGRFGTNNNTFMVVARRSIVATITLLFPVLLHLLVTHEALTCWNC
jgi:hypothetical protein